MAVFQIFVSRKLAHVFGSKKFRVKFAQVSKTGFKIFSQGFGSQRFYQAKFAFSGLRSFWSSQVLKIGFKVFSQSFGRVSSGFLSGLFFSGKVHFLQSHFFGISFGKFLALAFF